MNTKNKQEKEAVARELAAGIDLCKTQDEANVLLRAIEGVATVARVNKSHISAFFLQIFGSVKENKKFIALAKSQSEQKMD